MDIKEMIKIASDNTRIHFIRNLKNTDCYIIRKLSDEDAYEFILKSLHLPPHEESGYKDLEIEWAFAIECNGVDKSKFCSFLKQQIGKYVPYEDKSIAHWLGDDGWYELKDVAHSDKWLTDYYSYQQKNKASAPAIQTVLF